MNNLLYVTIWPTEMDSNTFHERLCELQNATLVEYYENGKPIKRWKDTKTGHMDIKPNGNVIVISG